MLPDNVTLGAPYIPGTWIAPRLGGEFPRFRAVFETGDMSEATRLAHDLKSVAGTLGAQAVGEAAKALNSLAPTAAGRLSWRRSSWP